jgi:hypothetical protein
MHKNYLTNHKVWYILLSSINLPLYMPKKDPFIPDNFDLEEDFPDNLPAISTSPLINYDPTPITLNPNDKDALILAISSYFDFCNTYKENPTFSGLGLHLGLSRHKLRSFPEDSPLFPYIDKARQYIVDFAEKQLFEPKSSAGTAFWLKNNDDWQDKHDLSISKSRNMIDILEEINSPHPSNILEGKIEDPPINEYEKLFYAKEEYNN